MLRSSGLHGQLIGNDIGFTLRFDFSKQLQRFGLELYFLRLCGIIMTIVITQSSLIDGLQLCLNVNSYINLKVFQKNSQTFGYRHMITHPRFR